MDLESLCRNGSSYGHNSQVLTGLEKCLRLPGAIYDIGAWRGTVSLVIAHYLLVHQVDKKIFLFDTFTGHKLSQVVEIDKSWGFMEKLDYFNSVNLNDLAKEFEVLGFGNYEFVVGDVLSTLPTINEKACFVSMDLNLYMPTEGVLSILPSKLVDGAILFEDDYANIAGITRAYDEHPEFIHLDIPGTGRGRFYSLKHYDFSN